MKSLLGILLVTGEDGRWHPGIGDPTFVGWLTVIAYGVACWLSWRAARLARGAAAQLSPRAPAQAHEERVLFYLWALTALVLLLLGVNKQLDLQSWLTQVARDMARSEGWYERRRAVQKAFILGIAALGFVGTAGAAYLLRRVHKRAMGTILGLGAIVSFVVIRAASFHNVDILISRQIFNIRMNWILELGGIAIVAVATHRAARRYTGTQRSS
jgi:hypothetical protein